MSYEGLGRALAGMLTIDLSVAPGLTLVERAQLDALTTELSLAESSFLDLATAQKLGKGFGAAFVVVGGYSVVGETFLLDAGLLKVETGDVEFRIQSRGASLFSWVGRWFYDFPSMLVDVPTSSDMVTALTKCMSVPEALRELEALRAPTARW